MRNLNDIEAKAILLLNEIETAVANGEAVPWRIVNAASLTRQAIIDEDAKLGADLNEFYKRTKLNISGQ